MKEMVYGIVPMSIQDWKEGKTPHVQPGVDIKFEKLWRTAAHSMDAHYYEPYSLEPKTAVLFEVPQSVVEKRAKESEEYGLIDHRWLGTLPARDIQEYSIYLANDALNIVGASFSQEVSRGEKPDYQQAYRMVAARAHSFETLNQILANTEPMRAAEVRRELQGNGVIHDNPEIKALRTVLSSGDSPSSMCFRANETHWSGIMYTDNIGMDAAMRTIQNTVKEMAPKLDVRSIEQLCAVYLKALAAQDSMVANQSPENLAKCISAALETFKGALAPEFQHVVDETQRGLTHNIERVQQDMMAPEAVVMRNAMQYATAYYMPAYEYKRDKIFSIGERKPLQGELQIYNEYKSQLGSTSGDFSERMLEAAKATLERVQETHMLTDRFRTPFGRVFDLPLDDIISATGDDPIGDDPIGDDPLGDDAK